MDMYTLKETLCRELKEYDKRSKLSLADLDAIQKLTSAIKNIGRIECMDAESGYSMRRRDDTDSFANRGRHYVRAHYSRDGSADRVIDMMRDMMEDATPQERDTIERMMQAARKG